MTAVWLTCTRLTNLQGALVYHLFIYSLFCQTAVYVSIRPINVLLHSSAVQVVVVLCTACLRRVGLEMIKIVLTIKIPSHGALGCLVQLSICRHQ